MKKVYVVYMEFYEEGRYVYGKYEDRRKANEIAMQVREERDVDTFVLAEEVQA